MTRLRQIKKSMNTLYQYNTYEYIFIKKSLWNELNEIIFE